MSDFASVFGRQAEVEASAPGRVNLMGEHTDYNGGDVLPLALARRTRVAIALRDDRQVRAHSVELGETITFSLDALEPGRGWIDYIAGVCMTAEVDVGFDVWLTSDVPLGAGLSSSAALEIALLRALRTRCGWSRDDVALAVIGQAVETRFVGADVGIMDQMAASLGDAHHALWIRTRTLHYDRVELPLGLEVVVINSGIVHAHATGGYNTRRAECRQAAALLGVEFLCDGDERSHALSPLLARRVRHVVTEHARVAALVDAFSRDDRTQIRALFAASHASMRDDYEVSVPEIDLLVALAMAEPEVIGARLTGGGFGGSIVLLTLAGKGHDAGSRIAKAYGERSGHHAKVM